MFINKVYAIGESGSADKLEEIDTLLAGIFKFIWPFVGVGVLGMFIYGGVMWLMSGGDPQKLQKAQATLLWTVVGAVAVAGIGLILGIFDEIFQLNFDIANPGNFLTE
jgi:hypothetical protein